MVADFAATMNPPVHLDIKQKPYRPEVIIAFFSKLHPQILVVMHVNVISLAAVVHGKGQHVTNQRTGEVIRKHDGNPRLGRGWPYSSIRQADHALKFYHSLHHGNEFSCK